MSAPNPKTHLGRAWEELAKPGPTNLHALNGELNPTLDELADELLAAGEQGIRERQARIERRCEYPDQLVDQIAGALERTIEELLADECDPRREGRELAYAALIAADKYRGHS